MENSTLNELKRKLDCGDYPREQNLPFFITRLVRYCLQLEKRVQELEQKNPVYGINFTENMKNGKS